MEILKLKSTTARVVAVNKLDNETVELVQKLVGKSYNVDIESDFKYGQEYILIEEKKGGFRNSVCPGEFVIKRRGRRPVVVDTNFFSGLLDLVGITVD